MPLIDVDGLSLDVRGRGGTAPQSPTLVLLHGFTGSGADWEPHLPALQDRVRVLLLDHIGHGRSAAPRSAAPYRMETYVGRLLVLFDRLGLRQYHLLGYSMGGRVALQLAVRAPERLRTLILESATAGLVDPAARRERVARDEALARFIETEGVEAFVNRWERLPLFRNQRRLVPKEERDRQRRTRLQQRAHGLAGSLRGMGTGAQEPVWDRLKALNRPVLLITGGRDATFCRLARAMRAELPSSRHVVVPDAGHNVHLERPAAFQRLVADFLKRRDPCRGRDR